MGCDVGITWHTDEHGAQAPAEEARATGRRAQLRHLDLTILPDAANVIDELAGLLGGVDVLVNNAGTGTATPLLDIDYATWRGVLATDSAALRSSSAPRSTAPRGRRRPPPPSGPAAGARTPASGWRR